MKQEISFYKIVISGLFFSGTLSFFFFLYWGTEYLDRNFYLIIFAFGFIMWVVLMWIFLKIKKVK